MLVVPITLLSELASRVFNYFYTVSPGVPVCCIAVTTVFYTVVIYYKLVGLIYDTANCSARIQKFKKRNRWRLRASVRTLYFYASP